MPASAASKAVMSWLCPGNNTKRIRLPSASGPQPWWSDRRATCRWPDCEFPFCANAMLMDPHQRRIDDENVFEIRII